MTAVVVVAAAVAVAADDDDDDDVVVVVAVAAADVVVVVVAVVVVVVVSFEPAWGSKQPGLGPWMRTTQMTLLEAIAGLYQRLSREARMVTGASPLLSRHTHTHTVSVLLTAGKTRRQHENALTLAICIGDASDRGVVLELKQVALCSKRLESVLRRRKRTTHTHARTHAHAHTHARTHVRAHTHTRTHAHTRTGFRLIVSGRAFHAL